MKGPASRGKPREPEEPVHGDTGSYAECAVVITYLRELGNALYVYEVACRHRPIAKPHKEIGTAGQETGLRTEIPKEADRLVQCCRFVVPEPGKHLHLPVSIIFRLQLVLE